MKDELITFETAKQAQKKGFRIPVIDSYNENAELGDNDGMLIFMDFNQWEKVKGSSHNLYSAPTQSLLQRWLREKHGIQFLSMCGGGAEGIEKWYKVTLPTCYTPNREDGSTATSKTYEEALEVVLFKALELIKI